MTWNIQELRKPFLEMGSAAQMLLVSCSLAMLNATMSQVMLALLHTLKGQVLAVRVQGCSFFMGLALPIGSGAASTGGLRIPHNSVKACG